MPKANARVHEASCTPKPGNGAELLSLYDQAWIIQGALGLVLMHTTEVPRGHIDINLTTGEVRIHPKDAGRSCVIPL